MKFSHFDGRRLAGAAGAVAAGLGAGHSAEAAIIFQSFDPPEEVAEGVTFEVDLGNDGVIEFDVAWAFVGDFESLGTKVTEFVAGTGVIMDGGQPANLALGTLIGPGTFEAPAVGRLNGWDNLVDQNPVGNFNDSRGYIGVEFLIGSDTHYGYVEFEGDPADMHSGRVYSMAWEDTPDTAIAAGAVPEPTSLALLAAGAAGLGLYRRRST